MLIAIVYSVRKHSWRCTTWCWKIHIPSSKFQAFKGRNRYNFYELN